MDFARLFRLFPTLAAASLLTATLLMLPACRTAPGLLGGSPRFVGEETLSRIEPGATDAEWIRAVLGKPKDIERIAQGNIEIWRYQYERVRSNRGSYLINTDIEKPENARFIYVQLANEVVTDWWRD